MHDLKLDYYLSGQPKEKTNELRTNSTEEFNEQERDTTEPNQQQQLQQQEQQTSEYIYDICTSMRTCIIFFKPNVANQRWGLSFQLLLLFFI